MPHYLSLYTLYLYKPPNHQYLKYKKINILLSNIFCIKALNESLWKVLYEYIILWYFKLQHNRKKNKIIHLKWPNIFITKHIFMNIE
jgi:hypothetical protein